MLKSIKIVSFSVKEEIENYQSPRFTAKGLDMGKMKSRKILNYTVIGHDGESYRIPHRTKPLNIKEGIRLFIDTYTTTNNVEQLFTRPEFKDKVKLAVERLTNQIQATQNELDRQQKMMDDLNDLKI